MYVLRNIYHPPNNNILYKQTIYIKSSIVTGQIAVQIAVLHQLRRVVSIATTFSTIFRLNGLHQLNL